MNIDELLSLIARGRTDLMVPLLSAPGGKAAAVSGDISALSWLVYYGDVTGLRLAWDSGVDFAHFDASRELGHAAFFGHWKVADFLLSLGADPNWRETHTGETPLHSALSKAGRPHYAHVVRLLLDSGADPNAATIPGAPTGAFMRDVRTKGETPLHRAAAFADAATISLLIDKGADRERNDAAGDTPLAWASWHLRPGAVLQLLAYGDHKISDKHVEVNTSDHGAGWGNSMERSLGGDYLPLSLSPR